MVNKINQGLFLAPLTSKKFSLNLYYDALNF